MSIRPTLTKDRALSAGQETGLVFLFSVLFLTVAFVAGPALTIDPQPLASDLWVKAPSLEVWLAQDEVSRFVQCHNLNVLTFLPASVLGLVYAGFALINSQIFRKVGK